MLEPCVMLLFPPLHDSTIDALCFIKALLKQLIIKCMVFFIYPRALHACRFTVKICHDFAVNSSRNYR